MSFIKIVHVNQVEFVIRPAGGYSGFIYSSWFFDWIGWKRSQPSGQPIKISVSGYGIQTKESFIDTSTIQRVAVRNDMDEAISVNSWLRKKLHGVAYRIDVECDHICYIIANGLVEEDANAICTDIYQILSRPSIEHAETVSEKVS